ncbi:hypothetical protein [Vibrio aerogenes]|uniref:hypothetical protein n=1 Tax=Vibrio aerogenes TaxID=92172 RepID=UPI001588169F|nr:hypothetical protein [Vibrio aerogenes]
MLILGWLLKLGWLLSRPNRHIPPKAGQCTSGDRHFYPGGKDLWGNAFGGHRGVFIFHRRTCSHLKWHNIDRINKSRQSRYQLVA